jgi:tellurite resistance protein TehA-like permease
MISEVLALSTKSWLFSDVMTYVMLAVYVFIFSLVIICLIRVAKYFSSAGKEQKLIRMELGKLAEEVHLLRQEQKDGKDGDSSAR